MEKELNTVVANELEDAEMIDLGQVSELTEGKIGGNTELSSASLPVGM